MLLYNVTIGIDKDAEQAWLTYMRESYIPAVMGTGLFSSHRMYKVLHDSEDGTISYSIQYFAPSIGHVNQYLDLYAHTIVEDHRRRFANRHVTFMTLLEEVAASG